MGKKKKKASSSVSPLRKAIYLIIGFCLAFFLLIGFSYLPGVKRDLDFAVRKKAKQALVGGFPQYQIETISANRSKEVDNMLTIAFLNKEVIKQSLQQQQVNQEYVSMSFNKFQIRIREFFITPALLLALLFLFTPIRWKFKLPGMFGGLLVLYSLLTLKLRAITRFELNRIYFPDKEGLLQNLTPYFSSPGLVFLVVLIIWMAIILPFVDMKKLGALFSW